MPVKEHGQTRTARARIMMAFLPSKQVLPLWCNAVMLCIQDRARCNDNVSRFDEIPGAFRMAVCRGYKKKNGTTV